jgi:hypothetical protein
MTKRDLTVMAYKDKEKEKEVKRRWNKENPDKVKATRARYNEKRRQQRLDPEFRAKEAARKRQRLSKLNDEEFAIYEAQRLERKRESRRKWAKANSDGKYSKIKERMEVDPEFAAKMREKWRVASNKRSYKVEDETPEQRDRRLQRQREYRAKLAREKKLMEQLSPAKPKKPEPAPKTAKPKPAPFKKMGRLTALTKWYGR